MLGAPPEPEPEERLLRESFENPLRLPRSWQTFDVGPFSFSAPADLSEIPDQGTDSLVGSYTGSRLSIVFDYGQYTTGMRCWSAADVEISGKRARLCFQGTPANESTQVRVAPGTRPLAPLAVLTTLEVDQIAGRNNGCRRAIAPRRGEHRALHPVPVAPRSPARTRSQVQFVHLDSLAWCLIVF